MSRDFWAALAVIAIIVIISASGAIYMYQKTQENYTPGCGLKTYYGTGHDAKTGDPINFQIDLPANCASPTPGK